MGRRGKRSNSAAAQVGFERQVMESPQEIKDEVYRLVKELPEKDRLEILRKIWGYFWDKKMEVVKRELKEYPDTGDAKQYISTDRAPCKSCGNTFYHGPLCPERVK